MQISKEQLIASITPTQEALYFAEYYNYANDKPCLPVLNYNLSCPAVSGYCIYTHTHIWASHYSNSHQAVLSFK